MSLTRSAASLVLVRGLGIVVQLAVIAFLAKTLSLVAMGVFAISYSVLGLIRYLGPCGIDQASTRQIAAGMAVDSGGGTARRLFAAGLILVAVAAVLETTVAIPLLWLTQQASGLSPIEIISLGISIPAFALSGVLQGQIRGYGYNLAAQCPEAIGQPVVMFFVLMAVQVSSGLDQQGALMSLAITGWAVVAIQTLVCLKIGLLPMSLPDRQTAEKLLREGWQIFHAQVFTAASVRAPLFLTSFLMGPAMTAIMEIALRFGGLASVVSSSVGATFSPVFARLGNKGDTSGLQKTVGRAAVLAGLPALAILILIGLFGNLAVTWGFPAAYRQSVGPMVIIGVASALNASLGIVSFAFLMTRRAHLVRFYSILNLVMICFGSVLLSPMFGVNGIAVSMVIGSALSNGGLMLALFRPL